MSEEKAVETVHSILAKAFGDKYFTWTNIKADKIALTNEEQMELTNLIEERDHYEIKQTIIKLRQRITND